MNYAAFMEKYPLLGTRVYTLHCESCKPGGVSETITYEGTETDGDGVIHVRLQYGTRSYKIAVRNGVIRAFGRVQSMRRPTRMRLSTGFSDYGEIGDLLLK